MTTQKLTFFLGGKKVSHFNPDRVHPCTIWNIYPKCFSGHISSGITTKEMMLKRDFPCAGWCHQQLKRGRGQTHRLLNFFTLQVYQPMKTSDMKMYEDVDFDDVCTCLFNNLFRAPNHCRLDVRHNLSPMNLESTAHSCFRFLWRVFCTWGCRISGYNCGRLFNTRIPCRPIKHGNGHLFPLRSRRIEGGIDKTPSKYIFLQKKTIHKLMVHLSRGPEFACIMPASTV